MIPVGQKQILHVDDADHVLRLVLEDRHPGEVMPSEDIDQLVVGCRDGNLRHVDAGNHNFPRDRVLQIDHIVDHVLFIPFDDAVLLGGIHQRAELGLGHGRLRVRIDAEETDHAPSHLLHDEDHRCEQTHQNENDAAEGEGKPLRVDGSEILRGDLAENDHEHGENSGRGRDGGVSEKTDCQRGGKRGRRDIDDVVADQDGGEHLRAVVRDAENGFGPPVSLLGQRLHPDAVDGGEGGLG